MWSAGRNNLCLWQYVLPPLPLNYSKPLHWEKAQGKAYKEGEKQPP